MDFNSRVSDLGRISCINYEYILRGVTRFTHCKLKILGTKAKCVYVQEKKNFLRHYFPD